MKIEEMAGSTEKQGLLHGFTIHSNQECCSIELEELSFQFDSKKFIWLHFDAQYPDTEKIMANILSLDPLVINSLIAEDTRPRFQWLTDSSLLLILRGMNPNAAQTDMISLRLWTDGNRVVTTQMRSLDTINNLVHFVKNQRSPKPIGRFLIVMIEQLADSMLKNIEEIEDLSLEIDEQVFDESQKDLSIKIITLQRKVIMIRRYLTPQKEALVNFSRKKIKLLTEEEQIELKEASDPFNRYLELLDSVRDRSRISQELLHNKVADQTNRRLYVVSIATALFLPLSFFTGLFGVNLSGIPESENPLGFGVFTISLFIVTLVILIVLKKLKWI